MCCSPKYHPEIAGEAIKYCWDLSKNKYHRHKLSEKRTKEKFNVLVEQCQDCITAKLMRVFRRRLHRYILAYFVLEKAKEKQVNTNAAANQTNKDNETIHLPEMPCALVEKLVKRKKLHCNIVDQEKAFLNSVIPLMKEASRNLL